MLPQAILSYLMSSDVIFCYAILPHLVSGCLMLSCPLCVLRRVMLSDDISRRHVRRYVILTGARLGYLSLPHTIPSSHSISRGTSCYLMLSYAVLSGGMLSNARSPDAMLRCAPLRCRRLRRGKASHFPGRQRSTSQRSSGPSAQTDILHEGREIRTPNLLIWSHTRCRCAIPPWEPRPSN